MGISPPFFLLLLTIGVAIGKDIVLFDENTPAEPIVEEHYGLTKAAMDLTVDPCDDFYDYACGNWNNVSEAYSYDTGALEQLNERVSAAIKEIFQNEYDLSLEPDYKRNFSELDFPNEVKARTYYESCMNKTLLEEIGAKPALDLLETLDGWPINDSSSDTESYDWLNLTAHLHKYGQGYLFGAERDIDIFNASNSAIYLSPGSLLLESPFMYMFSMGFDSTYKELSNILSEDVLSKDLFKKLMKLEKKLSKFFPMEFDIGDIKPMSVEDLSTQVPQIDWPRFLTLVLKETITPSHNVTVISVDYFIKAGKLIDKTSSRQLMNFLLMRFAHNLLNYLSPDYLDKNDGKERSEICTTYALENLEDVVSGIFVRKYFSGRSKEYATELIGDIRTAFSEFIDNTNWMEENTKIAAKVKLNGMSVMVGYPDNLFELESDLPEMQKDKFFENTIKILLYRDTLPPTEDSILGVKLYEVNAFYAGLKGRAGDAFFPAAIMQPPYFHQSIPKWANYGGIGFIIGHEMTHAFNTKHIRNNQGEESEWWDDESFKEFMMRTFCYYFQYNKYKFPGIKQSVKGQQTLDENMADNGGLTFSYNAYLKWLDRNEDSNEHEINEYFNLSGKQLFFVSFAQTFCSSAGKMSKKMSLKQDNHSPEKFRIIGALSNSRDFSKLYSCPIGSKMNPARKCHF